MPIYRFGWLRNTLSMLTKTNIAGRIQKRLQALGEPESEFLFSKAQNGDALFVIEALHDQDAELDVVRISPTRVELISSGRLVASFVHSIGPSLSLDCQSAERVSVLEMIADTPHKTHSVTAEFL